MANITVLDGGMGRELLRMGAPFRQPEWSALALIEAPEFVTRAHQGFVNAGADVITTNSYALVPFHLGESVWAKDAARLAAMAGKLAREVADAAPREVAVAGSIPPIFGSYRPDLFDAARAPELYAPLVTGLTPYVDLWLCETQSSIQEALSAIESVLATDQPVWVSFTLCDTPDSEIARDGSTPNTQIPRLRSNETVRDAVIAVVEAGADAVLFNCSQPEYMSAAIEVAQSVLGDDLIAIGAYGNAFPPQRADAAANEDLLTLRLDLTAGGYLAFAKQWLDRGATIVGGCCGIGPEHIGAIAHECKTVEHG